MDTSTDYQPYTETVATLPYTLNAIPVTSGGNVTIDGQQYIADYIDAERAKLVDRTGTSTLATTDPTVMRIYISDDLSGQKLETVLIHELGHAALFSYGLLPDIHKAVKRQYWMEAEEWVCNFIADYGMRIFSIAYEVMGEDAWMYIPYELDRLIA